MGEITECATVEGLSEEVMVGLTTRKNHRGKTLCWVQAWHNWDLGEAGMAGVEQGEGAEVVAGARGRGWLSCGFQGQEWREFQGQAVAGEPPAGGDVT